MRRAILGRLYEHLQTHYSIEWSRETFLSDQISLHEIDATLAFKSDPLIDDLRGALDRLDAGTYGSCISCKGDIPQNLLDSDPTRRFCATCERELNHTVTHLRYPYVHA